MKELISFIMTLAIFFCGDTFVMANDAEDAVLKFSVWDKETTVVDNILYSALQELGYELSLETHGLTSAILAANNGETDGITSMIAYVPEEQTENLIQIPVAVSSCEVAVFARDDFKEFIAGREDLKGLRVGMLYDDHHAKDISGDRPSETVVADTTEELYEMLLDDEIDLFLKSKSVFLTADFPEGVNELGALETAPMYTYVHKKHRDLIPALTRIYKRMEQDGSFEKFQGGESASVSFRNTILHITSYNRDMLWENSVKEGVREALGESELDYTIQVMSLNSKRIRQQEAIEKALFDSVRSNMAAERPDVILVSDNNAVNFVVKNYHTLFGGIPVVFCGVNGYSRLNLEEFGEYFTGITEEISAEDTIREMLALYPDTKKIYIINDHLLSGEIWKREIMEQATDFESSLEIEYNENLSLKNLLTAVSMLEPDTLILTGLYHVDSGGAFMSEEELHSMLRGATSLPVFSLMDLPVGLGAIGGRVIDGHTQGYEAGKMIAEILNGRPVSLMPVAVNVGGLNQWKFDAKALEDFGIDESELPEGSVVKNKRRPFHVEEPNLFAFIMSSGMLLAVAAAFAVFIFATRRQTKEARTAQKELERLMDELPVAIAIISPATRYLTYTNRFFRDMFGLNEQTLHKRYDYRRLFPEYQQNGKLSEEYFNQNTATVLSRDEAVALDWQYLTPGGNILHAHLTKSHIKYRGELCLVSIIQDMEAEKKRERLLMMAAEKEKEANQTKSRFLVNVSHEIRTPMNAIIGFSQLALLRLQDDENFSTFKRIDKAAQNLLSIINDILEFSSMDADKFELRQESFVLEQLIASAFSTALEKMENKKIEVVLNMSGGMDYQFIGDRGRIWQILKNTLDNSAKYTEEGRIIMDVFPAEDQKDDIFRSVVFRIEDTGLGMSRAQLKKLFTPFEQFHVNKTKNYIPGTGLGMSIIHELVKLLDGEITVESKEKAGTVVTVTLPLKREENPISLRDALYRDMRQKKVLVIDGDKYCLNSVSSLLSLVNITPVCVTDREEALLEIKRAEENGGRFDIVIADQAFTANTSPPLPRAIKNMTLKAPRCILSSLSYLMPTRERLTMLGFAEAIEKPFIPSVLFDVLGSTLSDPFAGQSGGIPNFSNVRTLMCEDNPLNQEVSKGMLAVLGITPVVAENGEEALELLKNDEFDLILMDIQMPVMDGITATKLIRNSETSYKDIIIIAVTANIMKDDIEKYLSIGMNSHLGKPLSIERLQKELLRFFSPSKTSAGSYVGSDKFRAATIEMSKKTEFSRFAKPVQAHLSQMNANAGPQNITTEDIMPKNETDLPLIDFTDGVTRFGGKEDRYLKVLTKVTADLRTPMKPFEEMLSQGSREENLRDVHTQKGVAGNLGLTKLFTALRSFEATLKAGEPDKLLYDHITPVRDETLEAILALCPEEEKPQDYSLLPEGSEEEFNKITAALLASLELSEPFGSEEGIKKLKDKTWAKLDRETIEKLESYVNDYDFYEAEEILRGIIGVSDK